MKIDRNPVTLPERTVITHNKNGTDYVFLTLGFAYNREFKRSQPKRMSIGKLNKDGMLIPNANYIAYFGKE